MTKTKALAILAAVAIAVLVSALEKRRAVSAYCIGIIIEENENVEHCNFVVAKLEGEDNNIAVDIISCPGDFETALETIEQSDIRLFFPTVKTIFIDKGIGTLTIAKSIDDILDNPSIPPDAVVVRAKSPSELAKQEEITTGLAGALFIPKLVEDRKSKISLVEFAEAQARNAPEVAFTEGRFYVVEASEKVSSTAEAFSARGNKNRYGDMIDE